jgi:sensor domain CHASE-containing protein
MSRWGKKKKHKTLFEFAQFRSSKFKVKWYKIGELIISRNSFFWFGSANTATIAESRAVRALVQKARKSSKTLLQSEAKYTIHRSCRETSCWSDFYFFLFEP